jgi:CRISPR-associated protein Cmr6
MDIRDVPLMFRAQVAGRCQLQFPKNGDAHRWVRDWVEGADRRAPAFGRTVEQRRYRIAWRFVTNGGQDNGVIRPVIGARGWPFYPGSSMKGAFRRACCQIAPDKVDHYCGGSDGRGGWRPGILRFHGGYPAESAEWQQKDRLVDVAHPQEGVQVEATNSKHSAFALFSLYRPELRFALSSNQPLEHAEWIEIWSIWEHALSHGIGSRVSAGYGRVMKVQDGKRQLLIANPLFSVRLNGEGQASYLLATRGNPGTAEFRPNMFKAALRGHTRRLFSGFVDKDMTNRLTYQLWGGIEGEPTVGLLGVVFDGDAELDTYGRDPFRVQTYKIRNGLVQIVSMREIVNDNLRAELIQLVVRLLQFSLLLGGFGRYWRRADHRIFYPQYYARDERPLIGCHWELAEREIIRDVCVPINTLQDVGQAIEAIRRQCRDWISSQPGVVLRERSCNWREAWHTRNKVQVWGRIASDETDCRAVTWFHSPYNGRATIKNSELTGGRDEEDRLFIGRIWHRMFPRITEEPDGRVIEDEYVELLTLFPGQIPGTATQRFINFLGTSQSGFTKLWPLTG